VSRKPIVAIALTATLAVSGSLLTDVAAFGAESGHRPASAAAKDTKKKKPVTVKVVTTPLGKILVTTKGFTLYAFDPDGTDTVSPKCIDACAGVWPAYVATKKTKGVGKGLKAKLLGIGGGGQVVYNDHLLYRFSGDSAAGDTNGQGVANIWHVVDNKGEPVVEPATTPST
jgi:predicted lipoprotein with Yx(FWY)xxD motif